jgi:hypothetical protein
MGGARVVGGGPALGTTTTEQVNAMIMQYSQFSFVGMQDNIVFIRDCNSGGRSVTNDAERVWRQCQDRYGLLNEPVRVVYCDSEGQWSEMVQVDTTWAGMSAVAIEFRDWHGLAWDRLQRP